MLQLPIHQGRSCPGGITGEHLHAPYCQVKKVIMQHHHTTVHLVHGASLSTRNGSVIKATGRNMFASLLQSDSLDRRRDDYVFCRIEAWVVCVVGAFVKRSVLQATITRLIVHQTPVRQDATVDYAIRCAFTSAKAAEPAQHIIISSSSACLCFQRAWSTPLRLSSSTSMKTAHESTPFLWMSM